MGLMSPGTKKVRSRFSGAGARRQRGRSTTTARAAGLRTRCRETAGSLGRVVHLFSGRFVPDNCRRGGRSDPPGPARLGGDLEVAEVLLEPVFLKAHQERWVGRRVEPDNSLDQLIAPECWSEVCRRWRGGGGLFKEESDQRIAPVLIPVRGALSTARERGLHGVTGTDVARRAACAPLLSRVAQILYLRADGSIRGSDGAILGRSILVNPWNVDGKIREALLQEPDELLVVPSGRMDAPHRTWGTPGAAAFNSWCERLRHWRQGQATVGRRVFIRPNHADVLSDMQRCISFGRAERGGLELAMDPSGLLAPSMIERAADHLLRFRDAMEGSPAVGAVALTNLRLDEQGRTVASPLHDGLLDPALLQSFADLAAGRRVPLMLMEEGGSDQDSLVRSWIL